MQLKFLPAHRAEITSSHRGAICADLFLLWLFTWHLSPLNGYRSESTRWIFKRGRRVIGMIFAFLLSCSILFFVFEIAVAPRIPSWWVATNKNLPSWLGSWPDTAVRRIPRALDVSHKTLVAKEPSPELLAAYYQRGEPIDSAWLQHAQGLDLTYRDLRLTNFERSSLLKADLSYSRLDGAILLGADLRGAIFTKREILGVGSSSHNLAELREIDLSLANFPEADLLGATMVFSDLSNGKFPGSDLRQAKLIGARGRFADLRGAALARVNAQGADFGGADLRTTDLRGANLLAANLGGSRLQGADLREAKLQGADLRGANLQGADLRGAVIFGARFDGADLSLADLRGITFVDPRDAAKALITELEMSRPYTAGAIYRHHLTLESIKSRMAEGNKGNGLEKVEHRDAIFDPVGAFSSWGNPIT
jgi:uncharacterized protein YjbI with pentapeptide repeats